MVEFFLKLLAILQSPGVYYYSGYKNPKEDELREKKVTNAKRTVPLMLSAADGIELIRTGGIRNMNSSFIINEHDFY